tara:strand:+ start:4253 stop:7402 length:3150 start_codon:yes stop_codon:yes gene_type:complete
MATNNADFKVKKGLIVTEDIELGHATDTTIARASAGQITVEGTAVVLAGSASHDGFSDFVANEHIDHSGVSISAGSGLTGGGTIAANRTLTVGAGNGITVNTNDVAVTAAQTTITSVLNTGLVIGRDSTDQIKFGTDNQIIFRVGNADGVTFKASGEIEATKFDGALEGNADTATAAATIAVVPNDSLSAGTYTNENNLIPFIADGDSGTAAGNHRIESADEFHYNPHTKILTVEKIASGLTGDVTGTATNATAITLGGHLISDVDVGTEFVDADDHIMSSGAIKEYVDANAGGGTTGYTYTDTAGSEQFLISDTSDTSLFKIIQTGTGDALEVHDEASDTTVFKVDQSGHVQIGTTSESVGALRVKGYQGSQPVSGVSTNRIARFEDGVTGNLEITSNPSNGDLYVGNMGGGNDLILFTRRQTVGYANYENLRLTANGEIGIEGSNFGTSGQVLTSGGSGNAVSWSTVSGGASSIDGLSDAITTATSNVGLGSGALDSLASGGNNNTAVGIDAGTAVSTGGGNCLIGFESGKAITNKSQNTLVGYQSGLTLNESQNTLIGYQAGKALVGHAQNTFIGAGTGVGATSDQAVSIGYSSMFQYSGTGGIAIGYQAGLSLTSADYPIFIGYKAGWSASTGARNIGVGYQALKSVGSSGDNIAIGYDALSGSIAGAEKTTAIGNFSLASLTSGDENLGIGYYAGNSLADGAENTLIGNYAGRNITSASRNVAIGHEALDANSTGNDNVAIASQALGAITTGSTNNIGIGFRAGKVMAANASYNTLIGGYEAGGGIGDGDYNVMIGSFAGQTATGSSWANTFVGSNSGAGSSGVSSKNTGLGYDSLGGLSTGASNIGIGYGAGDNITSGSNNVVIGKADVPSATGDSQLSISDGDGGVTWITGDSNGFVTHTNGSDHTFAIFGEEGDLYAGTGSTGNANGYQFSYGNGRANVTNASNGTDFGINVPHDCTLERVDVVFGNSGNVSSGTTTFVVVKNGSNQSGNLSTNHSSGIHDTHHTGLSHSFSAGDRFNLRVTTSSRQVGPMRMTARFRRTG